MRKISDTVGVIGILVHDNKTIETAAGSSSGGFLLKRDGRIGSAATAGAGFWCDERSCATTSGNGEEIIRHGTARASCRHFDSVQDTVQDFLECTPENREVGIVKLKPGIAFTEIVHQFAHTKITHEISHERPQNFTGCGAVPSPAWVSIHFFRFEGVFSIQHQTDCENECFVFEYGHSTNSMNLAVTTLDLFEHKREMRIIQSAKSDLPFAHGAFKFKFRFPNTAPV